MGVTLEQVNSEIASVYYFTGLEGVAGHWNMSPPLPSSDYVRLECLTFCVMLLRNGFMVTGVSSCAITEENNPGLGRDAAYDDALSKVFELYAFKLRDTMYPDTVIAAAEPLRLPDDNEVV